MNLTVTMHIQHSMPGFTADTSLSIVQGIYRSGNSAALHRLGILPQQPLCQHKVLDARCVQDASGQARCKDGFPGETCYSVQTPDGAVSCHPFGGHPECDPHGCGKGKGVHSYSQTVTIQCRSGHGVCNYAKVTQRCPMRTSDSGEPLGPACCTAQDSETTRKQALQKALGIINKAPRCAFGAPSIKCAIG